MSDKRNWLSQITDRLTGRTPRTPVPADSFSVVGGRRGRGLAYGRYLEDDYQKRVAEVNAAAGRLARDPRERVPAEQFAEHGYDPQLDVDRVLGWVEVEGVRAFWRGNRDRFDALIEVADAAEDAAYVVELRAAQNNVEGADLDERRAIDQAVFRAEVRDRAGELAEAKVDLDEPIELPGELFASQRAADDPAVALRGVELFPDSDWVFTANGGSDWEADRPAEAGEWQLTPDQLTEFNDAVFDHHDDLAIPDPAALRAIDPPGGIFASQRLAQIQQQEQTDQEQALDHERNLDQATTAASPLDEVAARQQHEEALDAAVRDAYRMTVLRDEEAGGNKQWIGLAEIRDEIDRGQQQLGGEPYSRAEVDAALQRVTEDDSYGQVNVIPEDHEQFLTDADRAAAVRFGGTDRHMMRIDRDPELSNTTDPFEAFHGRRRTADDTDDTDWTAPAGNAADDDHHAATATSTATGTADQDTDEHSDDVVQATDADAAYLRQGRTVAVEDDAEPVETTATRAADQARSERGDNVVQTTGREEMPKATTVDHAPVDRDEQLWEDRYQQHADEHKAEAEDEVVVEGGAEGKGRAAAPEATTQPAAVAAAEASVAVCRAERVVADLHQTHDEQAQRAEADYHDQVATWRATDEATTTTTATADDRSAAASPSNSEGW